MNPLTQVRNTQRISRNEVATGLADKASWHEQFKNSAYIYTGGLNFDMTEGDLMAVFAQYGEIVDVNLCRDKDTGKSRGFAFLAYEDQRSTTLAVDNLNGARVLGRIVRVEHVDDYKRKKEEVEGEGDAALDRAGAGSDAGPGPGPGRDAAGAGSNGGSANPWEGRDSVFQILQEAKKDVYGGGEDGDEHGGKEKGERRKKKRRKHHHHHRRRKHGKDDASGEPPKED